MWCPCLYVWQILQRSTAVLICRMFLRVHSQGHAIKRKRPRPEYLSPDWGWFGFFFSCRWMNWHDEWCKTLYLINCRAINVGKPCFLFICLLTFLWTWTMPLLSVCSLLTLEHCASICYFYLYHIVCLFFIYSKHPLYNQKMAPLTVAVH